MTNSTGGSSSPWDEPLDELKNDKPKKPTVVGNLDFSPESNQQESVSQKLDVPIAVEEKVGTKIEAKNFSPDLKKQPNEAENIPIDQPKKEDISDQTQSPDFWQKAYSQKTVSQNQNSANGLPGPQIQKNESVNNQSTPSEPARTFPPKENTITKSNNYTSVATMNGSAPLVEKTVSQPSFINENQTKKLFFLNQKNKSIFSAVLLGLLILFIGGVFLTEKGLISIGLEKVYGLFRLESIWGGLPRNPQNALAISAIKMKDQQSYTVTGEASVTINRGVKSDLISPIVAIGTLPTFAMHDSQIGETVKAILAAYENELENDSYVAESAFDDSQSRISNEPFVGDSLISEDSVSNQEQKPTVEEFKVNIESGFDDKVSGAKINMTSSSKQSSDIELVYSSGKIYLKSSKNIVFDPGVSGGWLAYDLKNFPHSSPSSKFWSGNFSDSDFSITGKRIGRKTISGVRCFQYSANVVIGGALNDFGLTNTSLSTLELEYYIGVNDHLIRQLNLEIIPNSGSAISRIDMVLNFSNFNIDDIGVVVPSIATPSKIGTKSTSDISQEQPIKTAKDRDSKRKADLAKIAKSLEDYKLEKGFYPKSNGNEKIVSNSGTLFVSLVSSYITDMPLDPLDPTYYYGYESSGSSYVLSAVLENADDHDGKTVGNKLIYFLKSQ